MTVDLGTSLMRYDINVWDNKDSKEKRAPDFILNVQKKIGYRVIAVGEPSDTTFNDRVQHRVNPKLVYVENDESGWTVVLDIPEAVSEPERPLTPISLPTD